MILDNIPAGWCRPRVILGVAWTAFVAVNAVVLPRRYAPQVEATTVRTEPMALSVRASGTLEAKLSYTEKAQFDGPVLEKRFREGQIVKKGERLLVLSTEKIRRDYQAKQVALQNAKADLVKATKELKLQKQLFRKQAVAYSAVEDAGQNLVKAKQNVGNAQEEFRLEQIRWDSRIFIAPFNGTIVKDYLGDEKLAANGKEVYMIADVSQYVVKARVDELDIKQVHEGQPATAELQIFPGTPLVAGVKEVGSAVEGNGVSEVQVILTVLDTRQLALRPKLSAEVRIQTGKTEPILAVPLTAVANTDGQPRVWVINGLGRVRAAAVELGRTTPDQAEIKQGLSDGQRVCTTAEPDFANGVRVQIARTLKPGEKSRTQEILRTLKRPAKKADEKSSKTPFMMQLPGRRKT